MLLAIKLVRDQDPKRSSLRGYNAVLREARRNGGEDERISLSPFTRDGSVILFTPGPSFILSLRLSAGAIPPRAPSKKGFSVYRRNRGEKVNLFAIMSEKSESTVGR